MLRNLFKRNDIQLPPEPVISLVPVHTSPKSITMAGKTVSICGNPQDAYFQNIEGNLLESRFLAQALSERVGPDGTIFDIGANIGLTTTLFANHVPQGTVTSFEPSPVAFSYLNQTIAANRFSNVTPINVALGSVGGVLPFTDNPQSATASHLNTDDSLGVTSHTVQVRRLDEYAPAKLDLIKIDVEGFERGVIDGGLKTIKALKPLVYVEFNSFTLMAYGNENPRAFLEYLQTIFSDIQFYHAGEVLHVNNKPELLHFLVTHLIRQGCISDLLCFP